MTPTPNSNDGKEGPDGEEGPNGVDLASVNINWLDREMKKADNQHKWWQFWDK